MPPTSFPDMPTCLIQAISQQLFYISPGHGFPKPNQDALKTHRNALYGGQKGHFLPDSLKMM